MSVNCGLRDLAPGRRTRAAARSPLTFEHAHRALAGALAPLAAMFLALPGARASDVLRCTTLNASVDCEWRADEEMYPGQGKWPATIDEADVSDWNRRWGGCRWDGAGACRDYFGRVVELSPLARPPDR
jgi:hypothetical protein